MNKIDRIIDTLGVVPCDEYELIDLFLIETEECEEERHYE